MGPREVPYSVFTSQYIMRKAKPTFLDDARSGAANLVRNK